MLDSICKSMGLRKIVPDNIRKIGNSTSSSIPILMKDDEKIYGQEYRFGWFWSRLILGVRIYGNWEYNDL